MGSGRIFFILECLMPASCSLHLFIAGYFPNGGNGRREFCSWVFFFSRRSMDIEHLILRYDGLFAIGIFC